MSTILDIPFVCVKRVRTANGYSAGYAITRTGYAMPELVPERARALARPVPQLRYASKMHTSTLYDHRNPLWPLARARRAPHSTNEVVPQRARAHARACQSVPELNAFKTKFLTVSLCKACWPEKNDMVERLQARGTCWCLWFGLGVLVDPLLGLAKIEFSFSFSVKSRHL